MWYIIFVVVVMLITGLVIVITNTDKIVFTRYRVKETVTGKFVPQFFALGRAPDLNTKADVWGWYPLREMTDVHVTYLVQKQFEECAEVADIYVAWKTIERYKARCASAAEKNKKPKTKAKYHYK